MIEKIELLEYLFLIKLNDAKWYGGDKLDFIRSYQI